MNEVFQPANDVGPAFRVFMDPPVMCQRDVDARVGDFVAKCRALGIEAAPASGKQLQFLRSCGFDGISRFLYVEPGVARCVGWVFDFDPISPLLTAIRDKS